MRFPSVVVPIQLLVLTFLTGSVVANAQNETTTTLATTAADTEDAKTQSLAWWVLVLGSVVAFPLLIGSCYAMLMWQQKAMHDYKSKFEDLLKALGENRRRTEQQLRRADKRRKRQEKKRRRELQALGVDVDQEEEDKDKEGGESVYGVHVNEDGLVIAFGGNTEETEALENLTPHQIACMNLLKSNSGLSIRDEVRRGPMMPPALSTYLEAPQAKRKPKLLFDENDVANDSDMDLELFEADRPYDSFTRARREILMRAKARGIRLPIKESYSEHGEGDNDLFMAAQAAGVLDEGFSSPTTATTVGGGAAASSRASPPGTHHVDPQMDPLSALALRSSALHSSLTTLRKSAPVKHSVDF